MLATFPFPKEQWYFLADPLAAHSGATVRDSHPLPFSPAVAGEHLGAYMLTQWNESVKVVGACERFQF